MQRGAAHPAQGFADLALVEPSDLGQLDRAAFAAEQRHPQLQLQGLYLTTDRALGQCQLYGGAGIAFVTRGGFKGQQQGHGWGEVAVIHS
ncbi:hypothetical protein D3C76_1340240 [compost metagenome]